MCGIAGFGGIDVPVEPPWIQKMTDALRHRGPDDEGYLALTIPSGRVYPLTGKDSKVPGPSIETFKQPVHFFLGHRRLSILDPSPAGHQPMSSQDENLWIVYNGEIYNYLELRETLRQWGYRFRTGTDTEVLLAAYERWGENCLERFDGMWSFVIYDRRKNLLFGARDRFGVKPLYYFHSPGCFAFASEIKALVTLPFVKKSINPAVVFDYLAFCGLDFVDETFIKGISVLQPSNAMIYDFSSGGLGKWQYYTLGYREKWEPFDEKKSRVYIEKTRELVFDAVRLRLRSDVPVGSALSGGIDSSTVVGVISRLLEKEGCANLKTQTGERQKVFTAGFPGQTVDESAWAKRSAEQARAQWFMTEPKPTELAHDLEDIAYYQDTPVNPPSVYAQYRVMRLARENGVKVLLDGQGADELFTGYTIYYSVLLFQALKHLDLKTFCRELNHWRNAPLDKKTLMTELLKQIRRGITPAPIIRQYRMKQKAHHLFIAKNFWEQYKERFKLLEARDFTSLNAMLHEFFTRQKLGNLLKYEDRNSMRFSIESRTPFADHLKLIEYVFQIPAVYKIHNGWSKYVLREAMKDILPEDIRLRTDKKGFSTPETEWLFGLKDLWQEYLTADLEEFVDVALVKKQLEQGKESAGYESTRAIWNIIGLAVWKTAARPA